MPEFKDPRLQIQQGFVSYANSTISGSLIIATGSIIFPDQTTQSTAPTAGGSGTPGGSSGQIQYNNGGNFGGVPTLMYTGGLLKATGSFTGSFRGDGSGLTGVIGGNVSTASLLVTASVVLNTITFTKGDGTTFPITVNTGSGGTTISTGSFVTTSSFNAFTASIYAFTSSYNTGSFTGSFTGSLFGTSSWATNALTTSLAPNYLLIASTSSMLSPYVLSSQTSSFVQNSQTSSFVTNSQTSSFVLNSQTSSFIKNSQTSSFILNSQTSSFVQNSQTGSFITNSQTSSFVLNSQTSSFVLNSQTSSMTVLSSSYAATASFIPTSSMYSSSLPYVIYRLPAAVTFPTSSTTTIDIFQISTSSFVEGQTIIVEGFVSLAASSSNRTLASVWNDAVNLQTITYVNTATNGHFAYMARVIPIGLRYPRTSMYNSTNQSVQTQAAATGSVKLQLQAVNLASSFILEHLTVRVQ